MKTSKVKTMTTFNEAMTPEEATVIFKFKGPTMFPNTEHNRKMIAKVIDNHLKTLRQ